jgi:segregation and condensation protein A
LEEAPREVEQILRDEIPLEVRIRHVLDLLADRESIAFEELFTPGSRRIEMVVTFMALLELIRLKQITAKQADVFGPIRIYRAESYSAEVKSVEEGELTSHGI